MVWWCFGANMADQRYKNAFKFLLQLLILSQKHILSVKKEVWDGLDVVWRWFGVFWGGLGCFHGPVYADACMRYYQKRATKVKVTNQNIDWFSPFNSLSAY